MAERQGEREQQAERPMDAASPVLKWRWRVIAVIVGILALAALGMAMFLFLPKGKDVSLEAVRAQARAKGFATSMQEFMKRRGDVSDDLNAAKVYEKAFSMPFNYEACKQDSKVVPVVSRYLVLPATKVSDPALKQAIVDAKAMDADPRIPIPEYILKDAKDYLSRRLEFLDLIHGGGSLPCARYAVLRSGPEQPIMTLLGNMRATTRLLSLAMAVDAEDGRPHDAVAKMRDGLAMARSLEGQPTVVGCLVEMACYSMLHEHFMRVIARSTPSNEDLSALQADIESFAEHLSARLPLEAQIALTFANFDSVRKGRTPLPPLAATYLGFSGTRFEKAAYQWTPSWITMGYYRADMALTLRYLMYVLERSDPPDKAFITQVWTKGAVPGPFAAEIASQHYVLAQMETRTTPRLMEQVERVRAKARAAVAALAALRFRNDTGGWPATLDALVPKYMGKVPDDPMGSGPMKYIMNKEGVVIYSIGENNKDDGGRGLYGLPHDEADDKAGRDDDGFQIWLPQATVPGAAE